MTPKDEHPFLKKLRELLKEDKRKSERRRKKLDEEFQAGAEKDES